MFNPRHLPVPLVTVGFLRFFVQACSEGNSRVWDASSNQYVPYKLRTWVPSREYLRNNTKLSMSAANGSLITTIMTVCNVAHLHLRIQTTIAAPACLVHWAPYQERPVRYLEDQGLVFVFFVVLRPRV